MEAGGAANYVQKEGAELGAHILWAGTLVPRPSGQVRYLPASLLTGMSPLLRAHLTQEVSDTQQG